MIRVAHVRALLSLTACAALLAGAIACKQEERPSANSAPNELANNADAIEEGKRLYVAYKCVACHGYGEGGAGPSLMDADWLYGGAPQQIFATIVEGRPGGMPSFRGKIPENQIWEIVAYVRDMSRHRGETSVEKPVTGQPGKSK